ncbi:hypothetical protein ES703_76986 [subsurface metagenome]
MPWWDIQLRFAELVVRCLWFIETWWEQRRRDKEKVMIWLKGK